MLFNQLLLLFYKSALDSLTQYVPFCSFVLLMMIPKSFPSDSKESPIQDKELEYVENPHRWQVDFNDSLEVAYAYQDKQC
jgi:hypothetical protein